jgi:hypothetical protein
MTPCELSRATRRRFRLSRPPYPPPFPVGFSRFSFSVRVHSCSGFFAKLHRLHCLFYCHLWRDWLGLLRAPLGKEDIRKTVIVTFPIVCPRLEAKFVRKSPHFTLDAMTLKVYDSVPLESMCVRKSKLEGVVHFFAGLRMRRLFLTDPDEILLRILSFRRAKKGLP